MISGAERALERLREAVDQLEVQLGTEAEMLPEELPWLTIDGAGKVATVTAAATRLLGLSPDAQGQVLGALVDMEGEPGGGRLLRVQAGERSLSVFTLAQSGGHCLIISDASRAEAAAQPVDRQLLHDLANILAVVRGRAEMASMDEIPERVRQSMLEIITAADRAQALLGEP